MAPSPFSDVSFVGGGEAAGRALGADCLVTRLGMSREGGSSFFGPGLYGLNAFNSCLFIRPWMPRVIRFSGRTVGFGAVFEAWEKRPLGIPFGWTLV